MRAPTVSDNRFLDSIIDCRRPGQFFFNFRFDSIIVTTLVSGMVRDHRDGFSQATAHCVSCLGCIVIPWKKVGSGDQEIHYENTPM